MPSLLLSHRVVPLVTKRMMNRFHLLQKNIPKFGRILFSTTASSSNVYPGAYLNRDVVADRIRETLKYVFEIEPETVQLNTHFVIDLQFDSLLRQDLNSLIKEEFRIPHIPIEIADDFITLKHIVDFIATHPKAR